jgi:DNA-binding protein HU-beta
MPLYGLPPPPPFDNFLSSCYNISDFFPDRYASVETLIVEPSSTSKEDSMNKAQLVSKIADEAKISKAAAEKALATLTKAITQALRKGDSVTLVGFGTFSVTHRKAREGRNPQTGQKIRIPARKIPRFRPGKALKDAVQ